MEKYLSFLIIKNNLKLIAFRDIIEKRSDIF